MMSNKMIHVTKISPQLLDENLTIQGFFRLGVKELGLQGKPVLISSTVDHSTLGKVLITGTLSHKVLGIAIKRGVKTILSVDDYTMLSTGDNLRREMRLVRDMIKLDLQAISFSLLQKTLLERFFQEVYQQPPILTHVNEANAILYYNYDISFQAFYALPNILENKIGGFMVDKPISQLIIVPEVIKKTELEAFLETIHYLDKTGFLLSMAHDKIFHVFRRERIPFLSINYFWLKQQFARILHYLLIRVSRNPIETYFEYK